MQLLNFSVRCTTGCHTLGCVLYCLLFGNCECNRVYSSINLVTALYVEFNISLCLSNLVELRSMNIVLAALAAVLSICLLYVSTRRFVLSRRWFDLVQAWMYVYGCICACMYASLCCSDSDVTCIYSL